MRCPIVRAIRVALLLGILTASAGAWAQIVIDYRLSILQGGPATPEGDVIFALLVNADWSTNIEEPFVVRLTVPPGLEPPSVCFGSDGEIAFDAETRVLSWSSSMNNPYLAERSCPLIFRVAPTLLPGTVLPFSAALTTSKADPNPSNDTATFTSVVLPSSDLAVSTSTDIHRFRTGTTFVYTFTVANLGPTDAQDVMFVDRLAPEVTFLSFDQVDGPAANLPMGTILSEFQTHIPLLPNGSTATFRLTVRANPAFESANIYNEAKVHSPAVDLIHYNNETLVWTYAGPDADLAVASSRTPPTSDLHVPITIEVTNRGPDAVQNVVLRNTLQDDYTQYDFVDRVRYLTVTPSQGSCSAPEQEQPVITPPLPPYWAMQCSLGALAPGAKATVTIVIERAPLTGPLRHSSVVTPSQNDPVPENNQTQVDFHPGRRRAMRR
jgi:uncharacterized repeat protein (TIGR01451 family)